MHRLDNMDNGMMRNRASPDQFDYADSGPPIRQHFGYHNDAQMNRRPSDGMRRQQELSAEFIPPQPFNLDENRSMQNYSPFVVFQGIFAKLFTFI